MDWSPSLQRFQRHHEDEHYSVFMPELQNTGVRPASNDLTPSSLAIQRFRELLSLDHFSRLRGSTGFAE
jgi:hypothetical protein